MKEELISVIVPIYNVEQYLEKCIESIISQTYKNLQIILIDDGSNDKSGKICNKYAEKDKRIVVIHKENAGVSEARNTGLDNAKGEWITFVDADDWIEEEYCQRLYNLVIETNSDVALCGYNRVVGTKKEKINYDGTIESCTSEDYLKKALNPQTGFGFGAMKFIKKSIIHNKFCKELVVCEDALFNIELSKTVKKAILVKENLYNYRMNNESVVKKYDDNYADKYLYAVKKIKKYLEGQRYDKEIMQNYYNFAAFHVLLIAVNYCYNPNNKNKNSRKLLKDVCNEPEFFEGIKKSNYDNISLTRKITLFTIKHKIYFVTGLICAIRQMQNNNKKEKK